VSTAGLLTDPSDRAVRAYRDAIVWDNHVCLPLKPHGDWMDCLARHRVAGATFISLNLGDAKVPLELMVRMAAHFRAWIQRHADEFVMAATVKDIHLAKAQGRTAVAFDIEGVRALGEQVSLIELLYTLGVRWMLFAYNRANLAGSGCHDIEDGGLTELGRRMLGEFERVGMVACCSHTGYRTARDVLEHATQPVIFSHSNPRALHEHPRNIPDDLIRGCAATGGVVGVNGLSIFLGGTDDLLGRFVAHIDYVAQLVGPKHVGIGLDFVYDQQALSDDLAASDDIWPAGFGYGPDVTFLPPDILPRVSDALLQRGYSLGDLAGILGGNFLRVAEQVWK
jgi:membrane dipeptidase